MIQAELQQEKLRERLVVVSIKNSQFNTKIAAFIFLILFIGFTAYDMLPYQSEPYSISWEHPEPVETPHFKAGYFPENETLTIVVTKGQFTRKSNMIRIRSEKYSVRTANLSPLKDAAVLRLDKPGQQPILSAGSQSKNLTLRGYDKTQQTNVWTSKSFYGLGLSNPGITDFPITEGESVTVLRDDTDTDKDGLYGIENGERVDVYTRNGYQNTTVRTLYIANDTVTIHGYRNSSVTQPRTGFWRKPYLIYLANLPIVKSPIQETLALL